MVVERETIMTTIRALLLFCGLAASGIGADHGLFNGKDLNGFDTFLRDKGLNNDPDGVFKVHDGMVHVSGVEYGYFITKAEYENYHLKTEFKWGDATHPPRKDLARD